VLSAFAGIVADPVQRWLGLHRYVARLLMRSTVFTAAYFMAHEPRVPCRCEERRDEAISFEEGSGPSMRPYDRDCFASLAMTRGWVALL
jgi:hypothetical protein